MKKFFMMAVMAVAALSANAQYAPEKGDFSTAIKFNPFSNNSTTFSEIDDAAIQGRYMVSDKDGIRLTLGFNYGKDKASMPTQIQSLKDTEASASSTGIGFKLGYERHFSANDRIDLYAGAQIGYKSISTKIEASGVDDDNKVASYYDKAGTNQFNAGIFTGINFYVYKKLFVGAEIGFNYANSSDKDKETEFSYNGTTTNTTTEIKGSSNSLGFKVEPALTLGWTF